MISVGELCEFTDKALDAMLDILRDLGDELANTRPQLDGANSPFVIVTHCLGVMAYWGGEVVAGRDAQRDRAAEFTASGAVAELAARAEAAREQLHVDAATVQPGQPPRRPPKSRPGKPPIEVTQGAVLLHIYEELAQHLGQLEITRDVLLAAHR
jgi:hypothetical protein